MVRVSIPILLVVIVGYALLIAVIFLFLDKYLDLRVVAYTADASRQATNLLHFLLNSDCTGAVKEKLVLDLVELREFRFEEERWGDCENLEYDYNFSVVENSESHIVVKKLVFDLNDRCYLSYQRVKGYAEMPVVVYREWSESPDRELDFRPGIASLTLMKTPLSELAFWVSQASLRIKEGHDEEVFKSIRVGPDVTYIMIHMNERKICMNGPNIDEEVCKNFFRQSDIDVEVCVSDAQHREVGGIKILDPGPSTTEEFEEFFDGLTCGVGMTRNFPEECKLINVWANATLGEVKIILP